MESMIKERFANALWCLSVGDAVGDVFEFKKKSQFSPENILQYANNASALRVTDDTQMTLFTADALIDFQESGKIHVVGRHELLRPFFENSYVDWYITQYAEEFYEKPGLTSFKELNHQRAPGWTCLSAGESLLKREPVINSSRGCGAVMRILPCAAIFANAFTDKVTVDYVKSIARLSGDVTHKHPEVATAINKLMDAYQCSFENRENFSSIDTDGKIAAAKKIDDLGEGWSAMECVNMAIWAVENSVDFDELLINSIWHSGDSDSVAAVACSIWGMSGRTAPIKYVDKIAEKAPIQYIIDRFK